jgi:DNA-binding transcriptional regulator LsrR (DeoR family)
VAHAKKRDLEKVARPTRPRLKSASDDPLLSAKVAFLRSEDISQAEIADRLGINASTVSRLLKAGGAAFNYLSWPRPAFQWSLVEGDADAIRALQGENELSIDLTRRLIEIYKVRIKASVILTHAEDNADLHEQKFNARAAELVWKLIALERTKVLGLTWGKSLASFIDSARLLRLAPPPNSEDIEVIPLAGESLGATFPSSRSSSSLAQAFSELLAPEQVTARVKDKRNRAVSAGRAKIHSLTMCPVFLPASFDAPERDMIEELLAFVPSYREIFGSKGSKRKQSSSQPPLAERLDVVVTSISKQGMPFGMGDHPDFVRELGLQPLRDVLIGDLGGVPLFIPSGDPAKQKKARDFYETHWLGLKADHLSQTAKKARAHIDGPAGVVVIASGPERAPPIHEAVKSELINELIIDRSAANALLKLLPK